VVDDVFSGKPFDFRIAARDQFAEMLQYSRL
jgi:hypothetical protein